MIVDTAYNIDTPEGVQIKIAVAGLGARAMAWLVDALVKTLILIIASVLLEFLGDFGFGLRLVVLFGLLWGYNVGFELMADGATPGKKVLGIRVVSDNGTPITLGGSVLRNLVRFVDCLPGTYGFGCLSMLVTQKSQRLGDLAAGTLVVYQSKLGASKSTDTGIDAAPLALPAPLTADEQQAVVTFAARRRLLARDRQKELTAIIKPVVGDVSPEQLAGYASWLTGQGHDT